MSFPATRRGAPDSCARESAAVHRREQGSTGVDDDGLRAAELTMAAKLRNADFARILGGTPNRASRALTGASRLTGGSRDVDSLATSRVSAPEPANPLPNMPKQQGARGIPQERSLGMAVAAVPNCRIRVRFTDRSRKGSGPGAVRQRPAPTPRNYTRLKIELWSVPVLSAKSSSSTPRDRRMLRYMSDIRVSPSRQ